MKKVVIYIHGNGGTADEAERYKRFFSNEEVIGFDYKAQTPWDAKEEFQSFFDLIATEYDEASIIANSIGAYFAMIALSGKPIENAMFISPIVNMEKLISDMMMWANVTETELCSKKEIELSFGETLSWEYLCYVRKHPIKWAVPTAILYGGKDNLTSRETISDFLKEISGTLTIMENGEHWFHTEEQMKFLDDWIRHVVHQWQ